MPFPRAENTDKRERGGRGWLTPLQNLTALGEIIR